MGHTNFVYAFNLDRSQREVCWQLNHLETKDNNDLFLTAKRCIYSHQLAVSLVAKVVGSDDFSDVGSDFDGHLVAKVVFPGLDPVNLFLPQHWSHVGRGEPVDDGSGALPLRHLAPLRPNQGGQVAHHAVEAARGQPLKRVCLSSSSSAGDQLLMRKEVEEHADKELRVIPEKVFSIVKLCFQSSQVPTKKVWSKRK